LGSSRDANAGVFVVMLDNVQTKIDGFSPTEEGSCAFTFSKSDLSAGFHNLSVSFVGRSPQAPDTSSGSFELNGIQYVSLIIAEALSELFVQAYSCRYFFWYNPK
jgi:hypothetical protein